MNTILSTLFIVLAAWFVISRFLPVERCSKYKRKRIKKYSRKTGKVLYRCSYSR
ncbi:putative rhodanese-like domain protein [Bacillus anthracis str. Vollum]|nr:putative rhodanese-like domain protein [Bacillus anthracis]AIK64475.1 putative rhodanese-like domain protein [Bacillus anthracis str. Vollum]AJG48679.1 putative rhodanese-like domain protein [Bacillus anthracis str. Turkey32]AJH47081.1 putative rhodanese-like domain protein [Bacillus anthracis str. Sterne]AJH97204.1 putative rhodanese-like domain protein [Bacillus anthracis str. V770-NP-1R]